MTQEAAKKERVAKVIEVLNKARSMELYAVHQYMNQHYNLDDLDYGEFASKIKLIAIDEQGRINLSIKKTLPEKRPERPQRPRQAVPAPVRSTLQKTSDLSFEDKLKHFMQASESRISDSRAFGEKRSSRRRGR